MSCAYLTILVCQVSLVIGPFFQFTKIFYLENTVSCKGSLGFGFLIVSEITVAKKKIAKTEGRKI